MYPGNPGNPGSDYFKPPDVPTPPPPPLLRSPDFKFSFPNPREDQNGRRNYYTREFPPQFRHRCPWSAPSPYHKMRGPFSYRRSTRYRKPLKNKERTPSPFRGTEEYTMKEIEETSKLIQKRLLMPDELQAASMDKDQSPSKDESRAESSVEKEEDKRRKDESTKNTKQDSTKSSKNQKVVYNVKEIHNKIISHLTNMSHGKKMNLICSTSSGYDAAINQIQKQKRLEISRALREMCSNKTVENNEYVNSIIPDIGIKIEDLPFEIIEQLSRTLDSDAEFDFSALVPIEEPDWEPMVCPTAETIEKQEEPAEEIDAVKNEFEECVHDVKEEENGATELKEESRVDFAPKSFEIPEIMFNESQDNAALEAEEQLEQMLREFEENEPSSLAPGKKYISVGTQVEFVPTFERVEQPGNFKGAVNLMKEIDAEIERLTKIRQNIFINFKKKRKRKPVATTDNIPLVATSKASKKTTKTVVKKKKTSAATSSKKTVFPKKKKKLSEKKYEEELKFNLKEKILVLYVWHEEMLLAGTETGKLLFLDLNDGTLEHLLEVSKLPLTSLVVTKTVDTFNVVVGLRDSCIKGFEMETKEPVFTCNVSSNVVCVESKWGFIFIGTETGSLLRYSVKRARIIYEENISESHKVLMIKAVNEGARKVLIIGSEFSPLCIRDAITGLYLRTMEGSLLPTINTFLFHEDLLFCATLSHIFVHEFNDGSLRHKFDILGIVNLRIKNNLIFAGCQSGLILVYNAKTLETIGCLNAISPIITFEVAANLLIVATRNFELKTILIPDDMRLKGLD